MRISIVPTVVLVMWTTLGCAITIEPGHRGLYFDSKAGLLHDPLLPGRHWIGAFDRIEDFDVTYSTHFEDIQTTSSEGLHLDLKIAVIYRPIEPELYELLTEIGANYYDEIVGPEFRSTARGVFARHSYLELLRKNEQIEDEVEADLRRRIAGKHVEVRSVTLESIQYAPEIIRAVQEKLAAEQDAARQKTILENDAVKQKTLLENDALRKKLDLENQAEQSKIRAESSLLEKQQEAELAKQQALIDKIREESEAAKKLIKAKSEAEAAKYAAQAAAEQARAHNQALTPLAVMEKGFEALKALGGSGTTIMLGDWSRVPSFLFPPALVPRLTAQP